MPQDLFKDIEARMNPRDAKKPAASPKRSRSPRKLTKSSEREDSPPRSPQAEHELNELIAEDVSK